MKNEIRIILGKPTEKIYQILAERLAVFSITICERFSANVWALVGLTPPQQYEGFYRYQIKLFSLITSVYQTVRNPLKINFIGIPTQRKIFWSDDG